MMQGMFLTGGAEPGRFTAEEKRAAMDAFGTDLGEVLSDMYTREYFLANPGDERHCSLLPVPPPLRQPVKTMIRKVLTTYKNAYAGLPRNAWLLSLVQFINRSGSMVLFFLTLYLTRKLGFTLPQAGQAVSIFGLGALAGAYLGGRLCDRLGANRVQQLSLLLSG